jgi:cellulose synthase/poly-beta-1,6-N-acetylglucosamine synthase-like glycosyltransferase
MIGRFVLAMFSLGMALIAFAVGSQNFLPLRFEGKEQPLVLAQHIHPECDASLSEYRSFAIVLYAHNAASWCEESLRSIFEQDYDHYRVLFVDDGSIDRTLEKAQQFILDNKQDHRFIAMRNESKLGKIASLYRSFDNCLDREIVIPMSKFWQNSILLFKTPMYGLPLARQ